MTRNGNGGVAGEKRTILIVEDNEMNRALLCGLLEDDYNILQAENGLKGLEQLDQHAQELSLVLLDVFMPECDGFEFLRRKTKEERFDTIPVIVTTASNSTEDEIRCLELGANDFVTKPYNVDIVSNRVGNMIRLRESVSMLDRLTWDRLTGLYNKEFFYQNAKDVMLSHPDTAYDVICSDIENFKALNDRYGKRQCDRILHEQATRMMGALPGLVCGGRISADVFAFLIEHAREGGTERLEEILHAAQVPNFTVKFGVVEDADRTMDVSTICDCATMALRRIKGQYGVYTAFYDEQLRKQILAERQIVDSMEQALAERQFLVYYQPKHDLHANRTGGAEALVRWIHPELGFISPGLFIPIFERNGFVTKLDRYIWEEVCREIQSCRRRGIDIVPVSINVSRLDFDLPDLADVIAALADKYDVPHELLHIEVTESAYSDNPDQIIRTLDCLHDSGFKIELDDFGSGYSSLASLSTMKLDIMKLDMSMVRQATASNDFSMMQFSFQLAENLGLKTVSEGVETAEQVERLREMGCDYIQGYYYSRPLKQEEFEAYLA